MSQNNGKESVLVVDDVLVNLKILSRALSPEYKVKTASNGVKALEIVSSDSPDLILLDIIMPEMDGYEVCRILKSDAKTRDIPILFVSGKSDVEDEAFGLSLGASDYIRKPFHLPIVMARIKNQLILKKKTDLLERMASIDSLTNIPNRRHFDRVLIKEWNRARRHGNPLSLIIMDVDFFKKYNDHYGHIEGDKCLRRIAETLDHCLRRSSEMVARYGGEEFAIILPETLIEGASILAERLRQKIESLNIPHKLGAVGSKITISGGLATLVPDSRNKAKDLVAAADRVLYQAKTNGRNQVVADPKSMTTAGTYSPID